MTSLLWSLVVALVCTGVAMAADENYDISVKVVTPKKTLATHVKSFGTVRKVFSLGLRGDASTVYSLGSPRLKHSASSTKHSLVNIYDTQEFQCGMFFISPVKNFIFANQQADLLIVFDRTPFAADRRRDWEE